jgi:hypothetical protein
MISQSLIEKLKNLFEPNTLITNDENMLVTFTYNDSASIDSLKSLINDFNSKLPIDYIEFLSNFDGCKIFNYDDLAGYNFLGTKKIKKENLNQIETYEEMWDENIIVFCEVLGCGDFISFKIRDKDYEILDCCHDDLPKDYFYAFRGHRK